ncbi:MAG: ABC transporter permease [Deltaproteobacteria bacterium]|nr:ABC transporter permease [Deltaproteobacteria bacterium]
MIPLLATMFKELLLLVRDRSGLLVLFVMPAVLVVVVSLVQENVLKSAGETAMDVLFVDLDHQDFGKRVQKEMGESSAVKLVTAMDGQAMDAEQSRALVEKGLYQVCIVIPPGTTEAVQQRAMDQISDSISGAAFGASGAEKTALPRLIVYFDPLIHGAFRSSVLNALKLMLLTMELEMKARILAETLPVRFNLLLQTVTGQPLPDPGSDSMFQMDSEWGTRRLMDVVAGQSRLKKLPTSVQHNVSAWAVFGMFFIVLPLGGVIIRERQDGTFVRLRTLPVPYLTILLGKLMAYVTVCWGQFLFIVLVGKVGLPLLGAPVLTLGSDPMALVVVVTSIALAACGYGIMLGTLARTFEQASMFGPVSVVCAAAIGGIMVPVYAMPHLMQKISLFSPLAWGLNALVEIFVREGSLRSVLPELGYLTAFFAVTLIIAWVSFRRRDYQMGATAY